MKDSKSGVKNLSDDPQYSYLQKTHDLSKLLDVDWTCLTRCPDQERNVSSRAVIFPDSYSKDKASAVVCFAHPRSRKYEDRCHIMLYPITSQKLFGQRTHEERVALVQEYLAHPNWISGGIVQQHSGPLDYGALDPRYDWETILKLTAQLNPNPRNGVLDSIAKALSKRLMRRGWWGSQPVILNLEGRISWSSPEGLHRQISCVFLDLLINLKQIKTQHNTFGPNRLGIRELGYYDGSGAQQFGRRVCINAQYAMVDSPFVLYDGRECFEALSQDLAYALYNTYLEHTTILRSGSRKAFREALYIPPEKDIPGGLTLHHEGTLEGALTETETTAQGGGLTIKNPF